MSPQFTTFIYTIKNKENIIDQIEKSGAEYVTVLLTDSEYSGQDISKLQKYLKSKKRGYIKVAGEYNEGKIIII